MKPLIPDINTAYIRSRSGDSVTITFSIKKCLGGDDMDILFRKLVAIPDTYSAFIVSVMLYADRSAECLNKMLRFLDTSESLTSSEVLQFMASQPDYCKDNANSYLSGVC